MRNLLYYQSLDLIRNTFSLISSNRAIILLLMSAIASSWQTCQPCDVMSADNYNYCNSSLVDDKLTKYESRAAGSGLIRYSRNELFSLRRHSGRPDLDRLASLGLLCYRRHRGGKHARERMTKYRIRIATSLTPPSNHNLNNNKSLGVNSSDLPISVISSASRNNLTICRPRQLVVVPTTNRPSLSLGDGLVSHAHVTPPTLYVLNTSSIAKPHAIEGLTADLLGYSIEVAVLTETHLKPSKHLTGCMNIDGYTLHRRDRVGRRGGGVAIYVKSYIHSTIWVQSRDNYKYEILWVQTGHAFIGALYYPPAPFQYTSSDVLDYIEAAVEELNSTFPRAMITLAGDFNQLPEQDIVSRTGLTPIVSQPTRGNNKLDRIYVSDPTGYSDIKIVTSVVISDHKAIIAFNGPAPVSRGKSSIKCRYRKKSPNQNALFLQHLSTVENLDITGADAQEQFDSFYEQALALLDRFYPEKTISISSNDPDFITPELKASLRRKNRLMRSGRIEEANGIARLIGKKIARWNSVQLKSINSKTDQKDMWKRV